MILAECIFSRSATGEVSSAYFRKLAISRTGCGVQIRNFRKRREGGEEGEEEEDEEEDEEDEEWKRRRNPNLTAAATKFPTLNVAAAARRREEIMHAGTYEDLSVAKSVWLSIDL